MDGFGSPECGGSFGDELQLSSHRRLAHGIELGAQVSQDQQDAQRRIRNAVRVGVVSGALTILFALFRIAGMNAWASIDAFVILGLTFGVYKRSRACAVALFVVWIVEKVVQWSIEPASLVGLPVAVLFGYFFYHGITGTNDYHRLSAGLIVAPEKSIEAESIERAVMEQKQRDQEEARNDLGRWV